MIRFALGGLVATFLTASTVFAQTTLPVRDADFGCIDAAKADQYVNDFSIDINSFGGRELCNAQVDAKKLFNDLRILEEGKFGPTATNNLIRGYVPADSYYSWMKSETRGVARGQDVPYATAYNSGGYFTMQDGWAQISTLGRVGTIVHEARHTEGYYHINCNSGPYLSSGVAGCDSNYNYGGSHAIEMEYYARVSEMGQNFHPVYKKMARLMAMGRANFVFNVNPLKQKDALMIQGQSGRIYLLNNGQWVQREVAAAAAGSLLKRTSFGAVLMNNRTTSVIDPYENSGDSMVVADDFSYFKLLTGDRGIGANSVVRDMEEFDVNGRRYVTAMLNSNQITSFNFPQGSWNSLVATPVSGAMRFLTVTPAGYMGLFLMDGANKLYSVNPANISQVKVVNETWPAGTKNFVKTADGVYQLTNDGKLLMGGQVVNAPEAVAQAVSVPVYDAFTVKP